MTAAFLVLGSLKSSQGYSLSEDEGTGAGSISFVKAFTLIYRFTDPKELKGLSLMNANSRYRFYTVTMLKPQIKIEWF